MKNKIEYFWETHYKFELFLKSIFGDAYKTKYSMTGNGIYKLVTIDNQIYELKYTQAKKMLNADDKQARDKNKVYIIDKIVSNLKDGTEYTISGGKFICFPVLDWIDKDEIIAKRSMPQ